MLDYVGWYLVELERRLRGRRSAQSTADLLLETRSHLEERVSDLVAKGLDPVSAAKAAITDFGDPSSVVHAYSYPVDTPRKAPKWALLVIALFAAAAMPFSLYFTSVVGMPFSRGLPGLALAAVMIAGVLVVALGAWTRRLVVLPAIVLMWAVAIGSTCWMASATLNLNAAAATGTPNAGARIVLLSAMAREQDMRKNWLTHYDGDFALLQKWRAHRTPENLAALIGPEFIAPYRSPYNSMYVADALPSLVYQNDNWNYLSWADSSQWRSRYDYRSPVKSFNMQATSDKAVAESQWKDVGDEYAAWLKKNRPLVEQDLRILSSASYGNVAQRWRDLAVVPFAFAACLSVVGLVLNVMVLLLLSVKDRLRRIIWRRQVA